MFAFGCTSSTRSRLTNTWHERYQCYRAKLYGAQHRAPKKTALALILALPWAVYLCRMSYCFARLIYHGACRMLLRCERAMGIVTTQSSSARLFAAIVTRELFFRSENLFAVCRESPCVRHKPSDPWQTNDIMKKFTHELGCFTLFGKIIFNCMPLHWC